MLQPNLVSSNPVSSLDKKILCVMHVILAV